MSQAQAATITVNEQPCPHFRGLFYYAFPWRWGTPCRYCLRYRPTQIIMVTPPSPPVAVATAVYSPATEQQQQQQQPPSYQSVVTQNYSQTVAVTH